MNILGDDIWFALSILEFWLLVGMIYVWDKRCQEIKELVQENYELKDKIYQEKTLKRLND